MLTLPNVVAWWIQAGVLVTAALLTLRLVRLDEPAVRYALLRGLLVVVLALPAAGLMLPDRAGAAAGAGTAVTSVSIAAEPRGEGASTPLSAALPAAVTRAVTVVLLAGIAGRLAWLGLGMVRLRGLRRAGDRRDDLHDEVRSLIGARAVIRYVRELGQPVTFGARAPVILVPASLLEEPPAIQRAVIAHEFWHVRRRDWTWTVVEEVIRAVFWFHPAVWTLISRIQAAREEVVDQLTILATGSRRAYAEALVAYADAPSVFRATPFAHRRHLPERLRLISKEGTMSARRVVGSAGAVACVVLSTGWYAVAAFPLVQGEAGALPTGRGPVELRAKAVTPENPIPRRSHFVPPDYPTEAAELRARGTVAVRVTLDETGHLAEARVTGLSMALPDTQVSFGVNGDGMNADEMLARLAGPLPADQKEEVRRAGEAFMRAAIRAVRQWQYERPFDGPLAFGVDVPLSPPGESAEGPAAAGSPAAVQSDGALRVGGAVKPPVKIRHVNPVYPDEAKAAGVQGVVIMEARIGPDGTVEDARVLRSIPMLDEAALEAVKGWAFTPTVMNGEPVPVVMTVTVNFTLQ